MHKEVTSDLEGSGSDDGIEDVDLHEEHVSTDPEGLGETIYAMSTVCLIRDWVWLQRGSHALTVRVLRMIVSLTLILAVLALQVFLLRAVHGLLCARAVESIRKDYGDYELAVYGIDHVITTVNGFNRGLDHKYLDAAKFMSMPDDKKHAICQIPLAHQDYTFAILFIWTLTCCSDLRKTLRQIDILLFRTPTVSSVDGVLEKAEEGAVNVIGLTLPLKIVIAVLGLLPRLISVGVLNLLGCRWLLATNDLSDLLLNALALEFMMVLKELLYSTLASQRNKFLTENTLFITPQVGHMTVLGVVGSMAWSIVAGLWVYMYIFHWQKVLPEYRWDIHEVCSTWDKAVHISGMLELFT